MKPVAILIKDAVNAIKDGASIYACLSVAFEEPRRTVKIDPVLVLLHLETDPDQTADSNFTQDAEGDLWLML